MLPFDRATFIEVFAGYNAAIWPAVPAAYALAFAMVLLLLAWPGRAGDRVAAGGLAAMWAWTGIAYHGLFFSAINPAAWGFAAGFVVQALLFLTAGLSGRLRFRWPRGLRGILAGAFIAYAAILYPVLGLLAGDPFGRLPMFGVAPCPVTIFTFGLLLCADRALPRWLLALPVVWAAIGGSAAVLLDMPQDWMLPAAAIVVLGAEMRRRVALRSTGPSLRRG